MSYCVQTVIYKTGQNDNVLPLIVSAILLCKANEAYNLARSCYLVSPR